MCVQMERRKRRSFTKEFKAETATQFSRFASALVLMGYQQAEANQTYSPSIFDAPPAERWFVSGGCIGWAPCYRNLFKLPVPAAETRSGTRD